MARIVGFQQAPDAPDGAGTFHFEDGSSMDAYSPNDAAPFMAPPDVGAAQMPPGMLDQGPDMRTAEVDPTMQQAGAAWDQNAAALSAATGQAMKVPRVLNDASAAAAPEAHPAPPPGPSHLEMNADDPNASLVQVQGAAPVEAAQDRAQRVAAGTQAEGGPGADNAIADAYRTAPAGKPGKAHWAPRSQTETISDAAATDTPEMRAEKNNLRGDVVDAQEAKMANDWMRYNKQSAEIAAQLPVLQQEAARRQTELERVQTEMRDKRAALEKQVDDAYAAKEDPRQFFGGMGGFAGIAAAIASGLSVYAATITGGRPYGLELVQKAMDQNIEQQRREIQANRAKADNQLSRLMKDYDLDLNEATIALQKQQIMIADRTAAKMAADVGQQQVKDAYQQWRAEFKLKNYEADAALDRAAMGKRSVTNQSAWVTPGSGGPSTADRAAITRIAHDYVQKGVPIEQAQRMAIQLVTGRDAGAGQATVPGAGAKEGKLPRGLAVRMVAVDRAIAETEAAIAKLDENQSGTAHGTPLAPVVGAARKAVKWSATAKEDEIAGDSRMWTAKAFDKPEKEIDHIGVGPQMSDKNRTLYEKRLADLRDLKAAINAQRTGGGPGAAEGGDQGPPEDADILDVKGGE